MNLIINEKNYSIDERIDNLLEAFTYIKENINQSFGYKFGCRSGICGSCSVRVNGVEQLACCSSIKEDDTIEPLKNLPILKDLIVDDTNIKEKLHQSKAYLEKNSNENPTKDDIYNIDIESNCILCNSCYSSCPVYEVNPNFIGPFALTRAYRYIEDVKEESVKDKVDAIQTSGVWDCTLCGNCNMVCPQQIDIKTDIMKLQNVSAQHGYQNPAFATSTFGGGFDTGFNTDFNNDFGGGFNPNGF
jgi:fumarate reductase iron-sulfur subunit